MERNYYRGKELGAWQQGNFFLMELGGTTGISLDYKANIF